MEIRFDPDSPGLVKFADSEAGLVAADNFGCQVTSIALTPSIVSETLPATLCRAESDTTKPSKWTLELEFLQDWVDASGLSFYLYLNDAVQKWFSLSLSATLDPIGHGQCTIIAGNFLGAASGALTASVSMPCLGKPDISLPA